MTKWRTRDPEGGGRRRRCGDAYRRLVALRLCSRWQAPSCLPLAPLARRGLSLSSRPTKRNPPRLQGLATWRPKAPKLRHADPPEAPEAQIAASPEPPASIEGAREVGEGRELTSLEKYHVRIKQLEEQERLEAEQSAG